MQDGGESSEKKEGRRMTACEEGMATLNTLLAVAGPPADLAVITSTRGKSQSAVSDEVQLAVDH